MGPEALGQVSFASSVAGYFVGLASFGIGSYGIREIARVRDNKIKLKEVFNELLLINCYTTIISLLLYFTFIFINQKTKSEIMLFSINGLSIILTLFSFEWLFQGLEKYKYILIRSIFVKIIAFILIIIFVKSRNDYILYSLLTIIGLGANNIFNLFYAGKIVEIKIKRRKVLFHLKGLFKFVLISYVSTFYLLLDKVILGFISGSYYVGLYAPAEKIVRLALGLVLSLSAVIFPRISNIYSQGDSKKAESLISVSMHAILLLAIPLFIGIEIIAQPVINIISGSEYASSVLTLRIEAFIIIPVSLANISGTQILIGSGKEKYYLFALTFGALSFIIASVILVPIFYQNGTAIAMVIAEVVICFFMFYYSKKTLVNMFSIKWIIPLVISSIVMGIVVIIMLQINSGLFNVLSSILVGVVIYSCILYLFKDRVLIMLVSKLNLFIKKIKIDKVQ